MSSNFHCEICDKTVFINGHRKENQETHYFLCHFEKLTAINREQAEIIEVNKTIRLDNLCKKLELTKQLVAIETTQLELDQQELRKLEALSEKRKKLAYRNPQTKNYSKIAKVDKITKPHNCEEDKEDEQAENHPTPSCSHWNV